MGPNGFFHWRGGFSSWPCLIPSMGIWHSNMVSYAALDILSLLFVGNPEEVVVGHSIPLEQLGTLACADLQRNINPVQPIQNCLWNLVKTTESYDVAWLMYAGTCEHLWTAPISKQTTLMNTDEQRLETMTTMTTMTSTAMLWTFAQSSVIPLDHFRANNTGWGPSSLAKLVYNCNNNSVWYL